MTPGRPDATRGLIRIAEAIPPDVDVRITLLSSEASPRPGKRIHLLERLTILLPILALLCFAGHILVSDSTRRGLLRVALGPFGHQQVDDDGHVDGERIAMPATA